MSQASPLQPATVPGTAAADTSDAAPALARRPLCPHGLAHAATVAVSPASRRASVAFGERLEGQGLAAAQAAQVP